MEAARTSVPVPVVVASLMASLCSSTIAQTVGWWRFDEGVAGQTAVGLILNSTFPTHGIPVGGPVYAAAPNACVTGGLTFDGINDRVGVPDAGAYAELRSITVETFLQTDGYRSSPFGLNQIVFRGDDQGGADPFFVALQSSGRVGFFINNVRIVESPTAIPSGPLLHIAATLDDASGDARLYIDRQLVAQASTAQRPTGVLTGPRPGLGFGNVQSASFAQYFDGTIYEVRISSAALTPAAFLPVAPGFASQPESTSGCPGAVQQLSIVADGPGVTSTIWQLLDFGVPPLWHDLNDGPLSINGVVWGTIAGAGTPLLSVSPNPLTYYTGSVLRFRCVISNSCGSATSDLATLSVCLGDFTCDGAIDGDDVIAFFTAWDAGDIAGDITGDGGVDGDDVIAFFGAWDSGC